jgi:hypothetical protein
MPPRREADRVQELFRPLPPFLGWPPCDHHWQLYVLQRREVRDEVPRRLLPDETDLGAAVSVESKIAELEKVLPIDNDFASRRSIQSPQDVEQCGLAAATRPDDGHEFASPHKQVQTLQGHDLEIRHLIDLHQVVANDDMIVRRSKELTSHR